jgi:heavy metal efflux system protein
MRGLMLERLVESSLRNRLVLTLVFLILLGIGARALFTLEVDAFPDTTPVLVQINTVAPALAPEEIERQVSFPIESSIAGLPGLQNVRSVSKFGFSQVVATFTDDVSILDARQLVTERLGTVRLPQGIEAPSLGPISTGLGEVFHYIVRSRRPERTLEELRTIHDTVVKPELRRVPGVAEVNSWGGYEKQFHVIVDPNALIDRGLTLSDITEALRQNNRNVGGGNLTEGGESPLLVGLGQLTGLGMIENVVVTSHEGVPIRVRDVATVDVGHEIRRGAVTADGQGEAVLGLAFMLMGENSRDVTRRLSARLDEVRHALPEDIEVEVVYDRTELVEKVIDTVRHNLVFGALLVIATLFLLFGSVRAGVLIALTIPFAMLLTAWGMKEMSIATSLLSLGALDFGVIVDGAVVMVENNLRRLAERAQVLGRSLTSEERLASVSASSREVARPVFFGILIITLVLVPVLALQGVEGKLFRPMALTFGLAMIAALLLAMLWYPALSFWLLPRRPIQEESRISRAITATYLPLLERALVRPRMLLGMSLFLVLGSGVLAVRLGSEFVPRLSEGTVVLSVVRLAGISIDASVSYNTRIERLLLDSFPDEIAHVWSRIGTAEVATDPMGTELTDIFIALKPRGEWKRTRSPQELVEMIQAAVADLPGQTDTYTQPIEMRMNELLAGIRTDLGVKVYGEDFTELVQASDAIQTVLSGVRGAANVSGEQMTGQPVVRVSVDPTALAQAGVPAEHVLEMVEAMGGIQAGEVVAGGYRYPLVVRLPEDLRKNARSLAALVIPEPGHSRLPLAAVAHVEETEGPATITREWARRRTLAQCNIQGRDIGSFVEEARRRVRDEVTLPPGYTIEFGGQFQQLAAANARFAVLVPLTLLLVFVLLAFSLRRLGDALLVYTGIPFAAVGGILALWLRGLPFSVSAGVGFIALSGIAVLNGQVLLSTIRRGMDEGLSPQDAVREAGRRRLRPVLATAITEAGGFLPMALSVGVGAEVQRPLATVVVGGVITSTLLTLFVLPSLVVWGGRGRVRLTAFGWLRRRFLAWPTRFLERRRAGNPGPHQ